MLLNKKNRAFLSLIVVFCIAFLYAPYFSSGILLPRTEELNYSLYPLIIFAKNILAGNIPAWLFDAGLGIPWPIPHTMSHTPLAILFGLLPVYKALGILLATHTCIQAYFTIKLCEYLKLSLLTTSAVLISILLAAPIEYMIVSDAAAVYMVWTLLPLILFSIIKLLEPLPLLQSLTYTGVLAATLGFGILNGHIGVFSTHVIGLGTLIFFQPTAFKRRWPWFVLVGFLAIGMGSEKLIFLMNELSYFGHQTARLQYTYDKNIDHLLWNFFVKPFVFPMHILDSNYWSLVINQNYRSRIITLGSPLCAFLLLAFGLKTFIRGIQPMPNKAKIQIFWYTFCTCFLLQFIPLSALPFFISASWTFRDPATLFGLLLAGTLCEFWLKPNLNNKLFNVLLLTHLLLVIMSALIFQYGPNLQPTKIGEAVKVYNDISQGRGNFLIHEILERAVECPVGAERCDPTQKRVMYDGLAAQLAHDGVMVKTGLHLNSLPIFGFQEVSYLTKGISLDSIHPSQSKPYGMISTLQFSNYHYQPSQFNWIKESQSLVNLFGIRIIIGDKDAGYESNGLTYIGSISTPNPAKSLGIYSNPTAFPIAFFANPRLLDEVAKKNVCPNDSTYATCQDFSTVTSGTDPWKAPIQTNTGTDSIELKFEPSEHERSIVVSNMWRPEWVTAQGKLSPFFGIMRVDIPPNQSFVELKYHSQRNKLSRNLTLLCSLICACLMLCFPHARRKLKKQIRN